MLEGAQDCDLRRRKINKVSCVHHRNNSLPGDSYQVTAQRGSSLELRGQRLGFGGHGQTIREGGAAQRPTEEYSQVFR